MAESLLNHFRVIEYAQNLSGMHCGMMLAEMGAEVIKVEIPEDPDDLSRQDGPIVNGMSATFAAVNCNKKSAALDIRTAEGYALMKRLIESADAFIITKRMKDMEILGLDYETVHRWNPKLIYGSVTCFGQYGPLSNLKGGDLVAQAAAGTMSITGMPENPPTRVGFPVAEMHAGINLCTGILASLYKVRQGGEGQLVDVSLTDTVVSEMRINTGMYVYNQRVGKRGHTVVGSGEEGGPEYPSARAIYKTKDGWIVYSANSPKLFACAAEAMGMGDILERADFKEESEQTTLCDAINRRFAEWAKDHDTREIFDLVSKAGAPAAPVLDYQGILEDENLNTYRHMFTVVEDPVIGTFKVTNLPVKWNRCQPEIHTAGPVQGQHTDEVLESV